MKLTSSALLASILVFISCNFNRKTKSYNINNIDLSECQLLDSFYLNYPDKDWSDYLSKIETMTHIESLVFRDLAGPRYESNLMFYCDYVEYANALKCSVYGLDSLEIIKYRKLRVKYLKKKDLSRIIIHQ